MKKKVSPRRFQTEPHSDKLYQTSIRAQGIIYVQDSDKKPNRSDIITVKPESKVQYHCFKRYRTFPYTFDSVIDENNHKSLFDQTFTQNNACQAINNQNDYMLYCCGSLRQYDDQMSRQAYKIFEQQLEPVFNQLVKTQKFTMRMNVVAVGEDLVYDLVSDRSIELRDISNSRVPNSCDIHFMGVQYEQIQSLYQIYAIIKATSQKKVEISTNSYYVIYCEFTSKNGNQPRRRMVLIDTTKQLCEENKSWDNNSHLVLNKCILALYGKMENKESYCPYRDSKITRIMKPFLVFNSRIDIYGFVSRDGEENALQTLNFVKNFSRLKIQTNPIGEIDNPETEQKIQTLSKQNLVMKQKIKTMESQEENQQKVNLHEQIALNANRQKKTLVALQKARRLNKLIKTKKWMSKLSLGLGQESEHLKNLEQDEIKHEQELQKSLLEEAEKLAESRIQTIRKSISKVQKLQLMKEYFTMALQSQKQETQQFLMQQQAMKQIYLQNIKIIQRDLKKSPHELLGIQMTETPQTKSRNINKYASQDPKNSRKRNSSHHIEEKRRLPQITPFQRRKTEVKSRVLKGRVDYDSFLSKNTDQYQNYEANRKKR